MDQVERRAERPDTRADDTLDEESRAQIRERLRWTPMQRLEHLRQLIAFEQLAARARRAE